MINSNLAVVNQNTNSMKNSYYHICVASEFEIMFRSESDYQRAFNCLALAVNETNSVLLADSIMSNHIHFCVQTDSPQVLVSKFRISYQRYFNHKYHRTGLLGDEQATIVELDSPTHCLVAITYVLRNPLHHGVTVTPFEYTYSSVKCYFRKELGNPLNINSLSAKKGKANIAHCSQLPNDYLVEPSGQICRDSVIDARHVEHLFGSPQDFLINLVRSSTKKWRDKIASELNSADIVSLESIENNRESLRKLEENERGQFNVTAYSDQLLCEMIDNELLAGIGKESVYQLYLDEKVAIARHLMLKFKASVPQMARCLAVSDDAFFRIIYEHR